MVVVDVLIFAYLVKRGGGGAQGASVYMREWRSSRRQIHLQQLSEVEP